MNYPSWSKVYYSETNSTGVTQCFLANHRTSSEQKNWSSFISRPVTIRGTVSLTKSDAKACKSFVFTVKDVMFISFFVKANKYLLIGSQEFWRLDGLNINKLIFYVMFKFCILPKKLWPVKLIKYIFPMTAWNVEEKTDSMTHSRQWFSDSFLCLIRAGYSWSRENDYYSSSTLLYCWKSSAKG